MLRDRRYTSATSAASAAIARRKIKGMYRLLRKINCVHNDSSTESNFQVRAACR
ncbi:hypothetical protein C7S14_1974 [Burkholderia cepacia]|nr:hypothetical protein C7S14_1974 [Burkholderia cepacia]